MTRAGKILKLLEQIGYYDNPDALPAQEIRDAFQRLLNQYFDDIVVGDVEVDQDHVIVTFLDTDDGAELHVIFGVDEEGAYAALVDDAEQDVVVDLDPLDPPITYDAIGMPRLDLTGVDKWMNKTTVTVLLTAGGANPESKSAEAYKYAVRGGKKVKIPIIRRHKIISPARRRALMKARRKAHTAQAKRKRKLSLKVRKRLHL